MPILAELSSGRVAWFRDWPNPAVPLVAAGVYTVLGERFIYAGMAGRGLSAEKIRAMRAAQSGTAKGLRERLASHSTGRRSGDQFCVYVADRLVLPTLRPNDISAIANGELRLDALVQRYIHERLGYRWIELPDVAETPNFSDDSLLVPEEDAN
jgi:hypothetical protein